MVTTRNTSKAQVNVFVTFHAVQFILTFSVMLHERKAETHTLTLRVMYGTVHPRCEPCAMRLNHLWGLGEKGRCVHVCRPVISDQRLGTRSP